MRARSVWPARLALALLLLVLCTASLLLWRLLENDQHKRLEEHVSYEARTLARQLESNLSIEVESLNRIARLWNNLGRLQQSEWEREISMALQGFPAYQSIQWVGADLRMRWLLPLSGNEAATNFRLTAEHPQLPAGHASQEQW